MDITNPGMENETANVQTRNNGEDVRISVVMEKLRREAESPNASNLVKAIYDLMKLELAELLRETGVDTERADITLSDTDARELFERVEAGFETPLGSYIFHTQEALVQGTGRKDD